MSDDFGKDKIFEPTVTKTLVLDRALIKEFTDLSLETNVSIQSADFEASVKSLNKYHALLSQILTKLVESGGEDDSLTLTELLKIVKEIGNQTKIIQRIMFEKRKLERSEEVNFEHPKIQKAFYFLFEAVLDTLKDVNVGDALTVSIVNNLEKRLSRFEEKLQASMRGVSLTMLDSLANPLVLKALGKAEKEPSEGQQVFEM